MAKMTKGPKVTPQDAELILKLYDLRREAVLRRARVFLSAEFWPQNYDEFKALVGAFGTEKNAWLRQVWTYWDMACTLVLVGAVNEDLFFQTNGEPYFFYAKFKSYIEQTRKDFNNPEFFLNIEKLVTKTPQGRDRVARLETRIKMRAAQMAAKAAQ